MKKEEKDYELDGLEYLELTPDEIKAHKTTRRFMYNLEIILVIGGIISASIAASGYGIYKCLPGPAKETINDVCSNIYQYLSQFPS